MRRHSSSREIVCFCCWYRMRKSFSSPLLKLRLDNDRLSSVFGKRISLPSFLTLSQLSFSLSTSIDGRLSIQSLIPSSSHSCKSASFKTSSDFRKIGIEKVFSVLTSSLTSAFAIVSLRTIWWKMRINSLLAFSSRHRSIIIFVVKTSCPN